MWVQTSKNGVQSMDYVARPCPANCVVIPESNAPETVTYDKCLITLNQIVMEMNLNYGCIYSIIHDKLGFSWVCIMGNTKLNIRHKIRISWFVPDFYHDTSDHFLTQKATNNNVWVHSFEPKTKQSSMKCQYLSFTICMQDFVKTVQEDERCCFRKHEEKIKISVNSTSYCNIISIPLETCHLH
jgi:hypothetical protein